MIDAFDVLLVITRTNSLYREMKQDDRPGLPDLMSLSLRADYYLMIAKLWHQLEKQTRHRLCKSVGGAKLGS